MPPINTTNNIAPGMNEIGKAAQNPPSESGSMDISNK